MLENLVSMSFEGPQILYLYVDEVGLVILEVCDILYDGALDSILPRSPVESKKMG